MERYNRESGTIGRRTGTTGTPEPCCNVLPSLIHKQYIISFLCAIFSSLLGLLCASRVCVCVGGSGSRSAPHTKTKKRARTCKRPAESDEEEEVVVPTNPTRREKSVAAKQRVAIPMHK